MSRPIAGIALCMAFATTGCQPPPPPPPPDPPALFRIEAQRDALRQGGADAWRDLHAATVAVDGLRARCAEQTAAATSDACRDALIALAAGRFPTWHGELIDAGTIEQLQRRLTAMGWECPDATLRDADAAALAIDGHHAWLRCMRLGAERKEVAIGLTLDDARTALLRLRIGADVRDLPLRPIDMADDDDGGAELIVRATGGAVYRVQLGADIHGEHHRLDPRLPELDADSALRVGRVAERQRDQFIARQQAADAPSALQLAEHASLWLSRLPPGLLRAGVPAPAEQTDPLRAASTMFARCRREHSLATQTCIAFELSQAPALREWFRSSLAEADRTTASLPTGHPVPAHLAVLREALRMSEE